MQDKVHSVGLALIRYGQGFAPRASTLLRIQQIGYSEQTAIFVLDLLEQPNHVTEALDELLAPDPPPSPNGGEPNDKT